jgi:site-specific DNA-methyltransferase (adenine-specific)
VKRNYIEVPVDQLKPYERNPRRNDHAVDYVAESIEQVGYITPIVCDENFLMLAGETRLKALKRRGETRVEVLQVSGLTEEQKKKYRLLDNKVGEIADWDLDLLMGELEEVDFGGFDFGFDDIEESEDEPGYSPSAPDGPGHASGSPDRSPAAVQDTIVEDEEFDIAPPVQTRSKLGDIYQLGRHRLMCGDSTQPDYVHRLMNGQLADLLITDPPYNVNYVGGTDEHLQIINDSMDEDAYREFLRCAFACADEVMRPGAVFYIWHADSSGFLARGACVAVGWKVRQCLIWNKSSIVLGRQDYQWKHEPCLYGWKEGAGHTWTSDRKQATVMDFNKPNRCDVHPTMKPLALFAYQIANNTNDGDIILDLFGGSGTSILACEQNNRTCYTMELDPRYVDVIIDRWEAFTGEKAVLLHQ